MEDGLIETYRAAFGYLPRLPMMREYGLRDGHGFRRFEGYSWLLLKALVQDRTSERCSAEWSIVTVLLREFVIRDRWLKGESATLL
jgi:hypothetical protein